MVYTSVQYCGENTVGLNKIENTMPYAIFTTMAINANQHRWLTFRYTSTVNNNPLCV